MDLSGGQVGHVGCADLHAFGFPCGARCVHHVAAVVPKAGLLAVQGLQVVKGEYLGESLIQYVGDVVVLVDFKLYKDQSGSRRLVLEEDVGFRRKSFKLFAVEDGVSGDHGGDLGVPQSEGQSFGGQVSGKREEGAADSDTGQHAQHVGCGVGQMKADAFLLRLVALGEVLLQQHGQLVHDLLHFTVRHHV